MSASTSELIRWSIQQSIDYYAHIVRRRMNLPDDEDSINKIRIANSEIFHEYLTDNEINRFNEYKALLLNWGE